MSGRRFFAEPGNIQDERVTLNEDETRHLRDVLRLKPGDPINVFDGIGNEYSCEISAIEKKRAYAGIREQVRPSSPESPLDLTIAAVLLKGDKIDAVVQKAVELGVNRFIPMTSIRCDVKVGDAAKRSDRWRRIALEATKQCGRAKLMSIGDVTDYLTLINQPADEDVARILFSERDGNRFEDVAGERGIMAFVGPEGGWDDAEIEAARTGGAMLITFGGRVMKADTAAISIAAVLQHHFGDLN